MPTFHQLTLFNWFKFLYICYNWCKRTK